MSDCRFLRQEVGARYSRCAILDEMLDGGAAAFGGGCCRRECQVPGMQDHPIDELRQQPFIQSRYQGILANRVRIYWKFSGKPWYGKWTHDKAIQVAVAELGPDKTADLLIEAVEMGMLGGNDDGSETGTANYYYKKHIETEQL